MNRFLRISWVMAAFIIMVIILSLPMHSTSSQANRPDEQQEVKVVIHTYFEARYRSFNTLQLEDITALVDDSVEGDTFLHSEAEKLEIEIQHAQQYQLRYADYEYFLDFMDIDIQSPTATVLLIEGHDVVFEISNLIHSGDPIVSSLRNLPHIIRLHKNDDGDWKIISDHYEDYLWKLIRVTESSADEPALPTNKNMPQHFASSQASGLCSLPDDESTHPYDRAGVVAYAHRWATAPRPYNHPPYDDYTDIGGDCTNFVSQAIHEGGNAAMTFGGTHGIGTSGWYYYNALDRSMAWNDVDALHTFIVNDRELWSTGTEGCDVLQYQAYEGDIIQYDWTNNATWDHSTIIVRSEDYGQNNRYHWIAAHTRDVDNYPFTNYIYTYTNMIYRFVHIERIDGYLKCCLPLVLRDGM